MVLQVFPSVLRSGYHDLFVEFKSIKAPIISQFFLPYNLIVEDGKVWLPEDLGRNWWFPVVMFFAVRGHHHRRVV